MVLEGTYHDKSTLLCITLQDNVDCRVEDRTAATTQAKNVIGHKPNTMLNSL
jgi:hypothetical protein